MLRKTMARVAAARIDGKTDRQSARDQDERRIAVERTAVTEMAPQNLHHTTLSRPSKPRRFDSANSSDRSHRDRYRGRQSAFIPGKTLFDANQRSIRRHRVGLRFHCRPIEQCRFGTAAPSIGTREIILHAADYDLRMLRRGLNFTASKIFDTVDCRAIAWHPRFSLGALVKCYSRWSFTNIRRRQTGRCDHCRRGCCNTRWTTCIICCHLPQN